MLRAEAVGEVPVEVSVNNGLTFQPIGTLKGKDAKIDFTDRVKGRGQYLLRVRLAKGTGLDGLDLRTVVTTCRAVYPKLKAGSTMVKYLADGKGAFEATPDFTTKENATDPASFVAAEGVTWSGYADDQKTAWKLKEGTGSLVYKVTAPAGRTLESVSAAACLVWVAPTKAGCRGDLVVASQPEGPWEPLGKIDATADDLAGKNSTGAVWVYGTAEVGKWKAKTAYVRVRTCGADSPSGVRCLRVYGTYPVQDRAGLSITYFWTSGKEQMRHTQEVPAGPGTFEYTIRTGKDVRNQKVIFTAGARP